MISPAGFEFLAQLEEHNERSWFEPRRDEFRRLLVDPLVDVLEAASQQLGEGPWPVSGGRRTIFRQLRDQRYAKAEPYATAVRALLTSTGSKPAREGCVHVEVAAGGGFVGVGFHRPPAAMLAPIRRRLLDEPDRWRAIVDGLRAAGLELADDRLVRMPRGFEPWVGHELAPDLRLRSIELSRRLDRGDWVECRVIGVIVDTVRASMPLLRFGNEAAGFPPAPGATPG
ncbi:MAG: TIGR02453 family protein [Actinomycetota bacterium]